MNDLYNKYSVEDLITDEHFIDWVLNPTKEKDVRWNEWMSKDPEFKSRVYEAKMTVQNLTFDKIDTKDIAPALWDRIQVDLTGNDSKKMARNKIVRWIGLAAAAAAVLLLLIINTGTSDITISINPGMANLHQLPDHSEVQINDGSSITYNQTDFTKRRDIFLEGEAFFEVTKGSPFTVYTGQGTVQVLGTSFNVFSHSNEFTVICKTGKVQVNTSTNSVILTPGEKATIKAGNLVKSQLEEVAITWLQGTFKYEESKLSDVTEELQRQFGVKIHLPESAGEILYTGFFLDNDLDKAMSSVFWPLKLKFEKVGNDVYVSRED